jgi:hypothetical protein
MTCQHRQPAEFAALSAAAGVGRRGNASATAGLRIRGSMPVIEVLHAERVYPDGDPAAHLREQLQRLLREAERQGVALFIVASPDGGQRAQAVRKPRRVAA